MGADIPSGRAARDAWRALSPQARQAARLAADRNVAPPDPGLAWAAAGYGRMMAGRLRLAALLAPPVLMVLVIATVAVASRFSTPTPGLVALLVLLLGFLAVVVVTQRIRRRYRTLYNSGLLGVEAAQLGVPVGAAAHAVWAPEHEGSGFTVPYQATVPVPAPAPRPAADAAAAGVQTVPARRRPVVVAIVLYGIIAACLWSAAIATPQSDAVAGSALAGMAALVTALLAVMVYLSAPGFRSGAVARFTPSGWELPGQRLRGAWSTVREIRVGPVRARSERTASVLAGYRVVMLMVDHPDGYLAQLPPLRRRLTRRTMNRYGSPIAILTGPRQRVTMVDLVEMLQRYTDAPVTWG